MSSLADGACENHTCDIRATCVPLGYGTNDYKCICDFGYKGDGVSCVDIDECQLGHDNCQPHQSCINSDGGFTCLDNEKMPLMHFKRKRRSTTIGKPCYDGSNDCDPLATCVPDNNVLGYDCICQDGFLGSGFNSPGLGDNQKTNPGCHDINECETGNGGCKSNCINTFGSYVCQDNYVDPCENAGCKSPSVCVPIKNDKGFECISPQEAYALEACDGIYCGQGFECQPYHNRQVEALELKV